MPRTKKAPLQELEASAPVQEPKTRKAYPSVDERIALADEKIARLEKLNAERALLVEKTAALLADRQSALTKSQEQLEKIRQRRERLIASKEQPVKQPRPRKAAADSQYQELLSALEASGKSMADLLAELKA